MTSELRSPLLGFRPRSPPPCSSPPRSPAPPLSPRRARSRSKGLTRTSSAPPFARRIGRRARTRQPRVRMGGPVHPSCASTYKSESKRAAKALFTKQGRREEQALLDRRRLHHRAEHQIPPLLRVPHKPRDRQDLRARRSDLDERPASHPPASGTLKPTPVGSGECQAKKYPTSPYTRRSRSRARAVKRPKQSPTAPTPPRRHYSRDGYNLHRHRRGSRIDVGLRLDRHLLHVLVRERLQPIAFNWGTQYATCPPPRCARSNPNA